MSEEGRAKGVEPHLFGGGGLVLDVELDRLDVVLLVQLILVVALDTQKYVVDKSVKGAVSRDFRPLFCFTN